MANILALPDDSELLAAVGRISISHSQLDYVLRLTVKTILGIPLSEARNATRRQSAEQLRKRVRKLAADKLGEGEALVKLDALITRAEKATQKRNRLIHDICYQDKNGNFVLKDDNSPKRPYPSLIDLNALQLEVSTVAAELNDARLSGFLAEALTEAAP